MIARRGLLALLGSLPFVGRAMAEEMPKLAEPKMKLMPRGINASGDFVFEANEGISFYTGTSDPMPSHSVNVGDVYINQTNGEMFTRTREGWLFVQRISS